MCISTAYMQECSKNTRNYTIYVSPNMVVKNDGFTKHYYAGTERVFSNLDFLSQFFRHIFLARPFCLFGAARPIGAKFERLFAALWNIAWVEGHDTFLYFLFENHNMIYFLKIKFVFKIDSEILFAFTRKALHLQKIYSTFDTRKAH
jgi:hypothetical protein